MFIRNRNENEIVIFKGALYLGYDLADVFFNRR